MASRKRLAIFFVKVIVAGLLKGADRFSTIPSFGVERAYFPYFNLQFSIGGGVEKNQFNIVCCLLCFCDFF